MHIESPLRVTENRYIQKMRISRRGWTVNTRDHK